MTGSIVSVPVLRRTLRLFREAGQEGLTREELTEKLGLTPRQMDRAVEMLEVQGAKIHRRREMDERGRSFKVLTLLQGPEWDERPSPLATALLELAHLPPHETGGPRWAELLRAIHDAADPHLTYRDRDLFAQLVSGIPRPPAGPTPRSPRPLKPKPPKTVLEAEEAPAPKTRRRQGPSAVGKTRKTPPR